MQVDEYSPRPTSPSRTSSIWNRTQGLLGAATDVLALHRWSFNVTTSDELRYLASISVWLRWLLAAICFLLLFYRPDFDPLRYAAYFSILGALAVLNGLIHGRILTGSLITFRWLLALSVMDFVFITGAVIAGGEFDHYFFYLLYYPALAGFAVLFSSIRLNLAWTSLVALTYIAVSLTFNNGLDVAAKEEKTLFVRIVVMYAIVASFSLVARFERVRRQEAVERERALHEEQIRLSKSLHDTTAQSAYMIGLGIETAIELAQDSNRELVDKLEATYRMSKSAMWELRYPIDIGLVVEGKKLGAVLEAHADTFTAISSIPTKVVRTGKEPPLPPATTRTLLSIAHNALTNAFRHSQARQVTVELEFKENGLRMCLSDDGIGLADDYTEHGHGLKNMRADAERIGGRFVVESGTSGQGTSVTCAVEYSESLGGS